VLGFSLLAACNHTTRAKLTTQPPPSQPAAVAQAPSAPVTIAAAPEPAQTVETAPIESTPAAVDPTIEVRPAISLRRPGGPAAPVRIGLLVPLSGPAAALGQALLDAAQIALFDAADPDIVLLPQDTAGTPEGAAAAAEALLSQGVQLVLGPLFAASVRAVAPLARARGVYVVAFSNDRAVAGDGVFLLGLFPEEQVARVVDLGLRQGIRRFAALVPETRYGDRVTEAFRRSVTTQGGQITRIETYPAGASASDDVLVASVKRLAEYDRRRAALRAQRRTLAGRGDDAAKRALARLRGVETYGDLPYEAVFLPDGGAQLRAVAPLLPYYDIDPATIRLLGTALWNDPTLGSEPALRAGWFAAPPPAPAAAFKARFREIYGRDNPDLASLGYDAMALASALARDIGGAEPVSQAALTDPLGFVGYGGIFRFPADGLAERGLAVLEVEPRGFTVVDPAPEAFGLPIN